MLKTWIFRRKALFVCKDSTEKEETTQHISSSDNSRYLKHC